YDVVIVGGGMVGAAVAALLGANRLTSRLRVAVLDVKPQPTRFSPPPVPDMRVSTVTPASITVLRSAGAWEHIAPPASAAFAHMQVWDSSSSGYIRWDSRDTGTEWMGIVAENTLLQAALLAAVERGGSRSEFIWPAEVRQLRLPPPDGRIPQALQRPAAAQQQQQHGLAEVELGDGRVLTTRLVVAADGAASRVRQMAGLRTWGRGYGQRGLVATVSTAEPSATAWQRFLPTGPLALLPVRAGYSNIVWSTTPGTAAALEAMSPGEFAAAVNKRLGPLFGSLTAPGSGSDLGSGSSRSDDFQDPPLVLGWAGAPPRSFPLQLKQAGRYTLPRLALVGDAAHAVHPLAGQGVNLGFGDARVLVEALAAAVETGTDPGDARMLYEDYEVPRRRAVLTMTAALDGIKRAFEV
ncbi:hypothetical protein VOLCADRAFT_42415, partial [Volvox carteri f. nagariensis]